jgi:hypothetical protein
VSTVYRIALVLKGKDIRVLVESWVLCIEVGLCNKSPSACSWKRLYFGKPYGSNSIASVPILMQKIPMSSQPLSEYFILVMSIKKKGRLLGADWQDNTLSSVYYVSFR